MAQVRQGNSRWRENYEKNDVGNVGGKRGTKEKTKRREIGEATSPELASFPTKCELKVESHCLYSRIERVTSNNANESTHDIFCSNFHLSP